MGKEVVGRVCRLKVLQKEDTLFSLGFRGVLRGCSLEITLISKSTLHGKHLSQQ